MATEYSTHKAAQCWYDDRTKGTPIDPILATVFAETLDREFDKIKETIKNALNELPYVRRTSSPTRRTLSS